MKNKKFHLLATAFSAASLFLIISTFLSLSNYKEPMTTIFSFLAFPDGTLAYLQGDIFPQQESEELNMLYAQSLLFNPFYDNEDYQQPTEGLEYEFVLAPSPGDGLGEIVAQSYAVSTSFGNTFELLNGGYIKNLSPLTTDEILQIASQPTAIDLAQDGRVEVLIIHSHATESFEVYDDTMYHSPTSRTTENNLNITAVGEKVVEALEAVGIGVIHDKTHFDHPQYNGSYDRSRVVTEQYLMQYPDIQIVLDIHRDAIESDGIRYKPVAEIDGKDAAQIMIISGVDNGDSVIIPNYQENLKFAAGVQAELEENFPGLTRPILFDHRFYNQDLTTGSILVEVGGHANNLEEALYTGELLGEALAEYLLAL